MNNNSSESSNEDITRASRENGSCLPHSDTIIHNESDDITLEYDPAIDNDIEKTTNDNLVDDDYSGEEESDDEAEEQREANPNCFESGANDNIHVHEALNEDKPLYKGSPITVAVSIMLIMTFAMRHTLTGIALSDLLTLIERCTA